MEDRIKELIEEYEARIAKNQRNQRIYNTLHYCIGYPQILCASILTFYTGADEFTWKTALGVTSTLLSVSLVFFNVQERAQVFKNTKQQYKDIVIDLKDSLALKDEAHYEEVYDTATEKEKFVTAYEQDASMCCDYFKV
jgi:hypothetical protein